MNSPEIIYAASMLRSVIESDAESTVISTEANWLVRALGGYADVSRKEPGQAALYILALLLSRLEDV